MRVGAIFFGFFGAGAVRAPTGSGAWIPAFDSKLSSLPEVRRERYHRTLFQMRYLGLGCMITFLVSRKTTARPSIS